MGFSSKSELKAPIVEKPQQKVRPLKWYKPDATKPHGKNIGLLGSTKAGKTMLLCLLGYFREEFRDDILAAGYDRVVEVMDKKILPTIHEIVVLETENNLLKGITAGMEYKLLKPLLDLDMFKIIPVEFERKEVALKDGKIESLRKEEIELVKAEFDYTIRNYVDNGSEHTLLAVDGMSGYKKILEDKFGMRVVEVIYKKVPREIHLLTERDFYIWIDMQNPADEQLKKLKKALVKLDIYTENLEYIDLRIAGGNGDKIIYKRR